MILYLVSTIFIVCVALAAAGIIIAGKMQKRHNHELFPFLLYHQIFIHAFGFYGIWGQVLIRVLLSEHVSPDQMTKISGIALLLGLPFTLFSWLILVRIADALSGRRRGGWFLFLFLTINSLLLTTVGYYTATYSQPQPTVVLREYFIFMNMFYTVAATVLLFFPVRKALAGTFALRRTGATLLGVTLLQMLPLVFYRSEPWLALLFILLFFTGNLFFPVYLNYGSLIRFAKPVDPGDDEKSFEAFCRRFDVSPRETEIIQEICKGLSNKEISEKLFISLQTVKDHTHRIYIKTNVKSRAQLMNLVKEKS